MRRAALVVVLAVAACGEDEEPTMLATSSSTAPPPLTACPVTAEEASFAIGAEVTAGFLATDGSATCTWGFDGGEVTLNIERGDGAEAHEQYEQNAENETVAGLGDDALWLADQQVLSVLVDDDAYMVLVQGADEPLAVATAIAELAI